MHHHFRMHVVDPVIVVAAVAKRRNPRHRALLGVGGRNVALLRRGMLFLDDAEGYFAEVLQLDLLLLIRLDASSREPRKVMPSSPTKLRQIRA